VVEQTKASKIVIVGPASTLDCGEMAMLATTVISLSSLVPNARFVMCSLYWENDFKWYKRILSKKYNLKVIGTFIPPSVRVLRYLFLLLRHIPEYLTSEIIVCIPGDGYSDLISGGLGSCFFSARLLLGAFLRKPTVLYAVSIGPFLSKLTRLVARLALNKTSLILAREESTKDYLLQLGVAKAHIQVTADSAFLLSPSPPERVKEILKDE
jgi:polysaccharide pyruvyl transferase WcaK-like protein